MVGAHAFLLARFYRCDPLTISSAAPALFNAFSHSPHG
jgi:hypothetical protein